MEDSGVPWSSYKKVDRISSAYYVAISYAPSMMIDPNGESFGRAPMLSERSAGGVETGWEGIDEVFDRWNNSSTSRGAWGNSIITDMTQGSGGGGSKLGYSGMITAEMFKSYKRRNTDGDGGGGGYCVTNNNQNDQTKERGNENSKGEYVEWDNDGVCVTYRLDNPESTAWDLDGDGKLSKVEADDWYIKGKGMPITVDNSNIDWSGLRISEKDWENGSLGLSTFQSYLQLPLETSSTYGGTSFTLNKSKREIKVDNQAYHYLKRDVSSSRDFFRNVATEFGKPVPTDSKYYGQPYMIIFSNPVINLKK